MSNPVDVYWEAIGDKLLRQMNSGDPLTYRTLLLEFGSDEAILTALYSGTLPKKVCDDINQTMHPTTKTNYFLQQIVIELRKMNSHE